MNQLKFIKLYNGRGKKIIRHKNVTEDMFWLLENGPLKDVTIETENGEVKHDVHTSVMCSRIPFFRRWLLRAERSGDDVSKFKIPNVTEPVMQYFLCFIYCGHFGIKAGLQEQEAKQLVELSHFVMLPELSFCASEMCPFIMLGGDSPTQVSVPFPCLPEAGKSPDEESLSSSTPPGTPPLLVLSPNSKIPKPHKTYASDIFNMISDPTNSDTVISYPDSVGADPIYCCSPFLVARCPFFEHQFCGDWGVDVDEKTGKKMCLMDPDIVPYKVLLDVLRYLATDSLTWLKGASQQVLEVLLRAADYLMLEELSNAMENYLAEHIDANTLCSVWKLGCSLQSEWIRESCTRFFINNFASCVKADSFYKLPHEFLKEALHTGEIPNSTSTVMENIDKWAHKQSSDPSEVQMLRYGLMPPSTMFNTEMKQAVLGFPIMGPGSLPYAFFGA
eukprot:TRINITY_DN3710_c1_g1_i1.p1 TRINITY_DN3710_c1_g1~~TRINITY_DN3710_c1_g1_i1.p1  ORF type:complete len:446 (+),score=74.22 TRINITY_DN3710_c1_g1_i1:67-1404(+)